VTLLTRLLPRTADNDYRGHPAALYTFCALATLMLGRSLIHFFKHDSGVNSIATIVTFTGDPDPNRVVYMYSALWGTQQLITVFVYGVVLLRYRNLLSLMYLLLIAEICFRMIVGTLHPLSEEFYASTPPGKIANLPLLAISSLMLWLSLRVAEPEREHGG